MKTKTKAILVALMVAVACLVGAPAATAGDGSGRICNSSSSVQNALASLDYLGRWGHYGVPPGSCRGGVGADMDAVFVPGGRVTTVSFSGFGVTTFNRCGRSGFWTKVSDFGAHTVIKYC